MQEGAEYLTEQQKRWFASMREGLERDTGRTLAEWVEIARACPATKPRARLMWFRETHGLLQNRAAIVLKEAFPSSGAGWGEPEALRSALWPDPARRAILEAVEAAVMRLPEVVVGQRKGVSAWSRSYQFAALRPQKAGGAVLGLALTSNAAPRLDPPKREGWSERLKACRALTSPADVTAELDRLLWAAWERS